MFVLVVVYVLKPQKDLLILNIKLKVNNCCVMSLEQKSCLTPRVN